MPPAGKAQGSDTGERSHAAIPLPDRAIEASWLIGLFAVPLVFSPLWLLIIYNDPKYFVLHLIAAVVVVAWTFEWAAGRRDAGPWTLTTPWGWAGRRPERWVVMSVAIFAVAAVISTFVSPAPRVSLWAVTTSRLDTSCTRSSRFWSFSSPSHFGSGHWMQPVASSWCLWSPAGSRRSTASRKTSAGIR